MGLFYKASAKKSLEDRNEIFLEYGVPALNSNHFERSPFPEKNYGLNNVGDFTYELCRLKKSGQLESVTIQISKDDQFIKIHLNIFSLNPIPQSLNDLKKINGIKFSLMPNVANRMRLRSDDYKDIPLFQTVKHNIKSYYTERGFYARLEELRQIIEMICIISILS